MDFPAASRSSTSARPCSSRRATSCSPVRRSASCWAARDIRTGRSHDQRRESVPSSGTPWCYGLDRHLL